jgi:phage repressor protein C with HTH and peptisase S24 domain
VSEEQHERLKAIRIEAGYPTAAAAAAAMGLTAATYRHHENGTAKLSRAGERYARFFRVSLEWLLTGRGEKRPDGERGRVIAVRGLVGAGLAVEMIGDVPESGLPKEIELPAAAEIEALIVRGDSMRPRFRDGEIVLFDPRPVSEEQLVNKIAIVQTFDGRRLIKMLRRGVGEGRWRLESDNADAEDDVRLIAAYRFIAMLPATEETKSLRTRPTEEVSDRQRERRLPRRA